MPPNSVQQTATIRDRNLNIACAALVALHKDDLPAALTSLLWRYTRVQLDLALDEAQRLMKAAP